MHAFSLDELMSRRAKHLSEMKPAQSTITKFNLLYILKCDKSASLNIVYDIF
jgi:hypothetical protein